MRRKKNKGCLPILAGVAIISLIAVGYLYGKKLYDNTLSNINKQISELPKFDEKAATEKIAQELKIPYPIIAPKKNREALKKEAESKVKAMTEAKYPNKKLAMQVEAILKKLRCVKSGQHVRFYLNTTRKYVSGTFRRIIHEHKDKFVKVGLTKYLYNDISEDYLYLFDPELAARQAAVKVREAKSKFKKNKSEYYTRTLERTTKEIYLANGYKKKDGAWTSNQEIVANMLSDAKSNFQRGIRKKKASIIEKNQFLGFIPLSPKKTENNSNKQE